MIGLVSVVACLLYLGRILAWAWRLKSIELGDVIFPVPTLLVTLVLRRRVRVELRQSATTAEVDLIDESIPCSQEVYREVGSGEGNALRR